MKQKGRCYNRQYKKSILSISKLQNDNVIAYPRILKYITRNNEEKENLQIDIKKHLLNFDIY